MTKLFSCTSWGVGSVGGGWASRIRPLTQKVLKAEARTGSRPGQGSEGLPSNIGPSSLWKDVSNFDDRTTELLYRLVGTSLVAVRETL
jgi:hypothetical protein